MIWTVGIRLTLTILLFICLAVANAAPYRKGSLKMKKQVAVVCCLFVICHQFLCQVPNTVQPKTSYYLVGIVAASIALAKAASQKNK